METKNYGHLSRQLAESYDSAEIEHLIPAINRLERIVSALESIGVNLDEEDVVSLELLATLPDADYERRGLAGYINKAVTENASEARDNEQENAIASLITAGFVLNDEDGETWTRDNATVTIELTNGREYRYRWEYATGPADDFPALDDLRPIACHSGVSGEFHRLLKLITPDGSDSACGGASPSSLAEDAEVS